MKRKHAMKQPEELTSIPPESGILPSESPVSALQHQAGNQAVQDLLRSHAIQTKPAVSQAGDPEEQEADQIAENIVRSRDATGTACTCVAGEEMCEECRQKSGSLISPNAGVSGQSADGHAAVSQVLRSPGHPVDAASRAFYESRFGRDFSNVRIHTGPEAAESADAINALAYTAGEHIVFGTGQYKPHSTSGARLLSHELAHVVQQQESSAHHIARKPADPTAKPSVKTGMFKGWSYVAYMDQGIIRFARDVLNEQNRRIGTVPWITNNPGNLTVDTGPDAGPAAKEPFQRGAFQKTVADQDTKTRRYAIFPSMEQGLGAIYWVLRVINNSNGGKLSLRAVLKIYKGKETNENEAVKSTYVGRIKQFMIENIMSETSCSQTEAEQQAEVVLSRSFSTFAPEDFDFFVAGALTREEGSLNPPGLEYSCANGFAANDKALYKDEQWTAIETLKSFKEEIHSILECP